ncbi:hypothetical protein PHLCEN_2v12169 [Hermanssonia centrifuga]|uniref:Uncharacterized protein n=1 Tax=Hermanssonia centrifuga TaxID=98765 RepID=A0A2R6NHX3_9APHY|nr:hypothetical protein PHLCEN_2v12169 [Hermanssonia centrifuga]
MDDGKPSQLLSSAALCEHETEGDDDEDDVNMDSMDQPRFEDSDDEDDDIDDDEHELTWVEIGPGDGQLTSNAKNSSMGPRVQPRNPTSNTEEEESPTSAQTAESWASVPGSLEDSLMAVAGGRALHDNDEGLGDAPRNVRQKVVHPSTPRSRTRDIPDAEETRETGRNPSAKRDNRGPQKIRVVVKDAAYATYRAVLYYIYTDTIVFAPLASSFSCHAPTPELNKHISPSTVTAAVSTPAATSPETQANYILGARSLQQSNGKGKGTGGSPTSRREWIEEGLKNNPGRPRPCSAKAVYRLADSE